MAFEDPGAGRLITSKVRDSLIKIETRLYIQSLHTEFNAFCLCLRLRCPSHATALDVLPWYDV